MKKFDSFLFFSQIVDDLIGPCNRAVDIRLLDRAPLKQAADLDHMRAAHNADAACLGRIGQSFHSRFAAALGHDKERNILGACRGQIGTEIQHLLVRLAASFDADDQQLFALTGISGRNLVAGRFIFTADRLRDMLGLCLLKKYEPTRQR